MASKVDDLIREEENECVRLDRKSRQMESDLVELGHEIAVTKRRLSYLHWRSQFTTFIHSDDPYFSDAADLDSYVKGWKALEGR